MQDHAPRNLIGLMVDQNPNVLIGMLAILKSGGGFVPIDPKHPDERIEFVLKDCAIEVLLTERKWQEKAQRLAASYPLLKHIICIDEFLSEPSDCRTSKQSPRTRRAFVDESLGSDRWLYVIYTSGSTGAPKGVPITHRNLAPMLLWSGEYFHLGERTKVLQNLSHCFDFGVFEVLTTMVFGGTLYFLDKLEVSEAGFYSRFVREHSINTIHSTPSFFAGVIAGEGRLDALETVHLGGEPLTWAAADRVFQAVGGSCTLHNGYGPTEASVNSTIFGVGSSSAAPAADRLHAAGIPIGRASANNRVYVLDKHLQRTPIGVPGELYVGGSGLSEGYLNRPALTAEKFIPDPFSRQPGARLYRTGDIVKFTASGEIEFIGRADEQVKIRGFRIEPGEIETAIDAMEEVKESVVIAREVNRGEKRLVAYVVPQPPHRPTGLQLRQQLRERLPDYMLPSAFVVIDHLPLTPNGKVDRRALPESFFDRQGEDYVAPRTPAEALMAEIWAEVLGVARVGVEDNFFELGGHSLLATQVMARVGRRFDVELPLRVLFETPTVASLARQVEQASGTQAALPIERISRDGEMPLSFAQQRLWVLDQLEPGGASYNISAAVRIKGALNVAALIKTLNEIVRRHESLRTRFPAVAGRPQQVIDAEGALKLEYIDLSALGETEQSIEAARLAREEAQQPFDLSAGPLLRSKLIRRSDTDHALLLTMHHIISDGWSLGVLVREMSQLYGAFVCGRETPLAELPIQYVDYSAWQWRWLSGEVLEKQSRYWREKLQGAASALELPTDRVRPAVQSRRGALMAVELNAELVAALRSLCRREGTTLYMVLLAAYQTLLYRYTGQEDISVGTPIAGRTRVETERLIGLFVNMLVMRTNCSGAQTFVQLLRQVRQTTLEAYAHQDMPLEMLVKLLSPNRDLSRSALFQVTFALQNMPLGKLELGEAQLEPFLVDPETAKFEMSLSLQEVGAKVGGLLEYNTDLFDRVTIERMFRHYRRLLESIVANPEEEIGLLPLLTDEEQRQLLVEWNDATLPLHEATCIHAQFETQVDRTPDAVALVCGDEEVTYAELDRRANRLAHYLRRLGTQPEALIGVCLSRSSNLVVALLGILKAGAAYVPLDPSYPSERLTYMLADSQAQLVLTDWTSSRGLPAVGTPPLCLDDAAERLAGESDERPALHLEVNCLAYVIYTSGSTGGPKGIAISHQSASALLRWSRDVYSDGEMAAVLAATSICFDLSVFEIFGPLTRGGAVIVARDTLALSELHARTHVTLINTVPSAAAELLRMDAVPASVRTFNLAGEALPQRLAQAILELPHVERLYNLYGPTEDTTYSTYGCVERGALKPPVIGKPILGTQAYVLDEALQPSPVGVVGELYLAGEGLARGYLRCPELTAARFIPDPFAATSGGRMYRTGDLARRLSNGELDYVGRIDHQVKVRGFRIELGEIEAALEELAPMAQSAVVVREDAAHNKRLVAYVVLDEQVAASELRDALRQRLPDHMIPSTFMIVDKLPLTPNGKVDRRALPEPVFDGQREDYVAPRTPVETLMAEIWSEVLGVTRVGVEDDFFVLGGDSLLNIQVTARANQAGIHVTPTQLFQARTIAALARLCERQGDALLPPETTHIGDRAVRLIATSLSAKDLKAEAILDHDIYPESHWSQEKFTPNRIFLTGGTGFLGVFLLDALLKQTDADIYCLIRCANGESGALRIRDTLASFKIWNEAYKERIIVVSGDLSRPRLGLAPERFDWLAAHIDTIYHNGAQVNLASPYEALKAANVQGSRELLRLACRVKAKPVHYVSTLSVFSSADKAGVILEGDEPEPPASASNLPVGYAQSKWVAEQLLASAQSRGLPVSIYRPGTITGDSRTGLSNEDDFFCRFIKGCIQLGSFPDWRGQINIIPVDYTSAALVHLSLQQTSLGKRFHLLNPKSMSWASFVNDLRSFGYRVEPLPYSQWRKAAAHSPENALYPLLPTLPGEGHEDESASRGSSQRREAEFDCSNAQAGLANRAILCPAADSSLIHTYLTCLIETGFLEAPPPLRKSTDFLAVIH